MNSTIKWLSEPRRLLSSSLIAISVVNLSGCSGQKAQFNPNQPGTGAEEGMQDSVKSVAGEVRVTGGVFRPGQYAWTNGMTVLDAIMAAGGFRESAAGVRVLHTDGTSEYFKLLRIIDESLEKPVLRPGDRLSVPRRLL